MGLLQELQKPLSWIDLMVLPIMLLVMALQSLYGGFQAGILGAKNGSIRMLSFVRDNFWTFLTQAQATLLLIYLKSVDFMHAASTAIGNGMGALQRTLHPICK